MIRDTAAKRIIRESVGGTSSREKLVRLKWRMHLIIKGDLSKRPCDGFFESYESYEWTKSLSTGQTVVEWKKYMLLSGFRNNPAYCSKQGPCDRGGECMWSL